MILMRLIFVAWLSVMLFFLFFVYVFTGSNNDKLPLEKRDSIISEKKISPNGQGLYLWVIYASHIHKSIKYWINFLDHKIFSFSLAISTLLPFMNV